MKQRRDMVIRSQKVKRNQQFAWMTHTRVGTTQKYREKVIEQGKVLMCCANTHRVWGASQAPPHCAVSLVNKIPESREKVYKAGAVEPIICDYAHDTRCDGKCLIWKDKFLDKQLFPMKKKICFPSFDEDYGNCNIERTNYENQCIIKEGSAEDTKANLGLKIFLNLEEKPVKQLKDGSNKKLSVLEHKSLMMLVEELYDEPYLSCNEDNFISKVPLLCECYRTPLFSLTQTQFYKG